MITKNLRFKFLVKKLKISYENSTKKLLNYLNVDKIKKNIYIISDKK